MKTGAVTPPFSKARTALDAGNLPGARDEVEIEVFRYLHRHDYQAVIRGLVEFSDILRPNFKEETCSSILTRDPSYLDRMVELFGRQTIESSIRGHLSSLLWHGRPIYDAGPTRNLVYVMCLLGMEAQDSRIEEIRKRHQERLDMGKDYGKALYSKHVEAGALGLAAYAARTFKLGQEATDQAADMAIKESFPYAPGYARHIARVFGREETLSSIQRP